MSQNDGTSNKSKRTATIKIAPKDSSKRNSNNAEGFADPGPGDPAAAPSVAPQLVDIPEPPTPSELVVKSASNSKQAANSPGGGPSAIRTLSDHHSRSGPKSVIMASIQNAASKHSSISGSQAGPAASNPSVGAPREPTSSRPLAGPSGSDHKSVSMGSAPKSTLGSSQRGSGGGAGGGGSGSKDKTGSGGPVTHAAETSAGVGESSGGGGGGGGGGAGGLSSMEPAPSAGKASSVKSGGASAGVSPSSPGMASMGSKGSGALHTEDEEGEGEMEHPAESPASPGASGQPRSTTSGGANGGGLGSQKSTSPADMSSAPASSGGGLSKASTKTGGHLPVDSSALGSSGMSSKDKSFSTTSGGKKKKVTKFRYHKRITVRTSGKTSPSAIMEKVHKKDHKAALTPSTIEDMDPSELMKRAGIKGTNKSHWRVRLRQTKRLTKNGKTTTQTKVAYRDSEGNKRIKTSSSPFCKQCGKKLEECKCKE